MKILLDPQIFINQQYGGISRYYTEVFSRLSTNNDIIFPAYSVQNIYFNESNLVAFRQKFYSLYIRILSKFRIRRIENTNERNYIFLKNKILRQQYDLFVATYYDTYFLKSIGSKPFVLTVYDMIHELFPEYFIDDKMVVRNKLLLMEKATRIIAVSENTKKDILKIYPHIDKSKIDVVYHGCSLKPNYLVDVCLPKKYILFVGNRDNYKNFRFFVESISELLKNDSDLYLLCAGAGSFKKDEDEYISKLGLKDKIIQKSFKEDELGFFYSNAKCFVFPSLYEGFGLPVLESMICGCPVVLAKHSSFPEVAGDAGFYYEVNNPVDLKNKIDALIQNETLRNEFLLKGLEQVKKFSWENAANQCLDVYKKCYKN